MNRVLSVSAYLVRKLWLLCAIVLVLFAVLLSVLRYTLPYLDEEKHLIEDYLSAQYGINLTIDSLSAAVAASRTPTLAAARPVAERDALCARARRDGVCHLPR